jgi:hypothetical protein
MSKALADIPEEERRMKIRRALSMHKDGWSKHTIERRLRTQWSSIMKCGKELGLIK